MLNIPAKLEQRRVCILQYREDTEPSQASNKASEDRDRGKTKAGMVRQMKASSETYKKRFL